MYQIEPPTMDHNEDDAYEVSSCVGSVSLLLLLFCLF